MKTPKLPKNLSAIAQKVWMFSLGVFSDASIYRHIVEVSWRHFFVCAHLRTCTVMKTQPVWRLWTVFTLVLELAHPCSAKLHQALVWCAPAYCPPWCSLARLFANWSPVTLADAVVCSFPYILYSTHLVHCGFSGPISMRRVIDFPGPASSMFSSKLLQGSLLVQKSTIPPELFCNHEVGTSIGIELFVVCVAVRVPACLPACKNPPGKLCFN